MHYFRHNIGDYAAATAHLSWDEDMALTRLLRAYFQHEAGILQGTQHRLARATTPAQRKAVDSVLAEFFTLQGDRYIHAEAQAQLDDYKAKSDKAKASANARWTALPPHSERNANAMRTHSEGNAKAMLTSNQEPVTSRSSDPDGSVPPPPEREPSDAATPYDSIVALYHEALPSLPRVRVMTAKRQTLLRNRWRWVLSSRRPDNTRRATNAAEALDWLREFFALAAKNDFVIGREGRTGEHATWQADIDYLLSDRGLRQVVERTREEA